VLGLTDDLLRVLGIPTTITPNDTTWGSPLHHPAQLGDFITNVLDSNGVPLDIQEGQAITVSISGTAPVTLIEVFSNTRLLDLTTAMHSIHLEELFGIDHKENIQVSFISDVDPDDALHDGAFAILSTFTSEEFQFGLVEPDSPETEIVETDSFKEAFRMRNP